MKFLDILSNDSDKNYWNYFLYHSSMQPNAWKLKSTTTSTIQSHKILPYHVLARPPWSSTYVFYVWTWGDSSSWTKKKGWSGSNSMRDIQKTSAGGQNCLPSRELTYPTFGKGKSSSKVPWELTYGQRVLWGTHLLSLDGSHPAKQRKQAVLPTSSNPT